MKESKRQWEHFAFYDKTAIEEKLETMAAQGWMIEQPGNYLWRYRRIEPTRLHFCVTYFPNASEFDPRPTDGQQQMEDFCARDGWILAARWGQMQIFYNTQENPLPIETDPVTQVETIQRAMKRNMLPTHFLLLALCLYQLGFTGWQFLQEPVDFLATPTDLFMVSTWLLLLVAIWLEVYWYFRWHKKAIEAAEGGVFLELKTNHTASFLLLGISAGMILFAVVFSAVTRWATLIWLVILFLIMVTARKIQSWLKQKGASRNINRAVSIGSILLLTLALLGMFTTAIIHTGMIADKKPIGTYDFNGWEMNVYADELPLYVQDLTDTACKDWSTSARTKATFLAAKTEYRQIALTLDRSVPNFEYSVMQVKVPFLYDYCKNSLINSRQDEVRDGVVLLEDHYDAIDATPWQAQEAYRVYWSGSYLNKYLLCYEDTIVEIHFDWEPTAEQMQIVAEKLGRK